MSIKRLIFQTTAFELDDVGDVYWGLNGANTYSIWMVRKAGGKTLHIFTLPTRDIGLQRFDQLVAALQVGNTVDIRGWNGVMQSSVDGSPASILAADQERV